MKIRNGFVSNSSSSSFVICLPENFDINSIDFEKASQRKYCQKTPDQLRKTIEKLINDKGMDQYDGGDIYSASDILKDYIIASMETGPDAGQIILVDVNKVKKIVNNET